MVVCVPSFSKSFKSIVELRQKCHCFMQVKNIIFVKTLSPETY